MNQDKVSLTGIVLVGHHGVTAEERKVPRRYEVDVEMTADLRCAGQTDDLQHTIDYRRAYQIAHDVVCGESCLLLESVAEKIADRILADLQPQCVVVRVRKPSPPLDGPCEYAEVEVQRCRDR